MGIYCRAYLNDSNTVKSGPVIKLARQLLFSIRFETHPISITDLIFYLINFTYRTDYFQNPVTPKLITDLNVDIANTKKMATANDLRTAFEAIFGANGVNLTNAIAALAPPALT